jgi:DNA-binding transcriptional LysR family regulator
MKNLSLNQLRAVEAVAAQGSFSAAAKQLGISQPSVSNNVSAVEARYKVQLFDRRGYSAIPTAELQSLLPKVRSTLLLVQEMENQLSKIRDLKQGQLRIGYSTYQVAMPILAAFMQRFPDVQVEARSMASYDLLRDLREGMLDLALVTAREIPGDLSGIELCKMHLMLAVPKSHPFASRSEVSLKDLQGQPLIQRETSSATRRLFEAQARLSKLEMKTVLAVGSWGSILELAQAGVGIGVGLDIEVKKTPGISVVPLKNSPVVASQFLVYLDERKAISTVQAFLDIAISKI